MTAFFIVIVVELFFVCCILTNIDGNICNYFDEEYEERVKQKRR